MWKITFTSEPSSSVTATSPLIRGQSWAAKAASSSELGRRPTIRSLSKYWSRPSRPDTSCSGRGTLYSANTSAGPWSRTSLASARFIAGDPMKVATNRFSGASNRLWGVLTCINSPSLSTATRVPKVMASIWSWVT